MSIARWLPVLVLVTVLAGCANWMEMAGNSAGLDTPAKLVDRKVAPDLLIATDGDRCRVPASRFEAIEPGDLVTCLWAGAGTPPRFRTAPRRPGPLPPDGPTAR